MKRRTCPKCNEILGEYDYFFCSSCGTKLPEELVKKPRSIRIKTYKLEDAVKKSLPPFIKKLKDKTFIYSFFLLIFISVVVFGIYSTGVFDLIFPKTESQLNVEVQERNVEIGSVIELEPTEKITIGDFSKTELATYFPANVSFYFEAFDLNEISNYFTDIEGLKEVFSRSQILFEDNYAGGYFKEEESWVLVFKIEDKVLVEKIIEDVQNDGWSLYLMDDALVMYQNEDVLEVIEDVRSKVVPNLALNPQYIEKIKDLPNEGSVRIVILDEQIRENFVSFLESLDEDTASLLTKIINSSEDGFLIK